MSSDAPLFADLGVRPETVEALAAVDITRAFAIQALTLPIALAGSDLIGQARTGTGKTLGFGIPLLDRVVAPGEAVDTESTEPSAPQALVVVPTRELCVQVTRDLKGAASTRGIRVAALYGGRSYEPQVAELKRGVEVVVGTPGRLLDLANQRILRLDAVSILVLDEADEMLDLGFLPDIERILTMLSAPPEAARQTMLFSATMPAPIITLARRFMHKPVHVRAEDPGDGHTVPTTAQHVFRTHTLDKVEVLARILQAQDRGLSIVFCRTKRAAARLSDELADRGFAAAAVHGDLGQGAREQALRAFRAGKVDVLVATDVAARGIDVTGVTHVVNYGCPEDEKTYLHRIGRTGRAGASGVAVTLVDWDELARWQLINKALVLPFDSPVETYSTSGHLHSELSIPEKVSGTLPRAQRTRAGLDAEQVEDLTDGRRVPRGRGGRQRSEQRGGGRSTKGAGRSRAEQPEDKPLASGGRRRRRTRSGSARPHSSNEETRVQNATSSTADGGSAEPSKQRRPRRRTRGGRPANSLKADSPTESDHPSHE